MPRITPCPDELCLAIPRALVCRQVGGQLTRLPALRGVVEAVAVGVGALPWQPTRVT